MFHSNYFFRIPDDFYIGEIKLCHADMINELWPLKSAKSLDYVKTLISMNGGIGLFDRKTDELVSWVLTNDALLPT